SAATSSGADLVTATSVTSSRARPARAQAAARRASTAARLAARAARAGAGLMGRLRSRKARSAPGRLVELLEQLVHLRLLLLPVRLQLLDQVPALRAQVVDGDVPELLARLHVAPEEGERLLVGRRDILNGGQPVVQLAPGHQDIPLELVAGLDVRYLLLPV